MEKFKFLISQVQKVFFQVRKFLLLTRTARNRASYKESVKLVLYRLALENRAASLGLGLLLASVIVLLTIGENSTSLSLFGGVLLPILGAGISLTIGRVLPSEARVIGFISLFASTVILIYLFTSVPSRGDMPFREFCIYEYGQHLSRLHICLSGQDFRILTLRFGTREVLPALFVSLSLLTAWLILALEEEKRRPDVQAILDVLPAIAGLGSLLFGVDDLIQVWIVLQVLTWVINYAGIRYFGVPEAPNGFSFGHIIGQIEVWSLGTALIAIASFKSSDLAWIIDSCAVQTNTGLQPLGLLMGLSGADFLFLPGILLGIQSVLRCGLAVRRGIAASRRGDREEMARACVAFIIAAVQGLGALVLIRKVTPVLRHVTLFTAFAKKVKVLLSFRIRRR